MEKNINEKDAKLNDKLNDRFSQLSTEINELKRANAQLTKINSALIEQNKKLRALSYGGECESDGERGSDSGDNGGAAVIDGVEFDAIEEVASGTGAPVLPSAPGEKKNILRRPNFKRFDLSSRGNGVP